jgi:DNA polymerase-3 subunit epsilon
MAYLILDTETTGLYPGNIAQLAALKVDEGKITAFNEYYTVNYVDPKAEEVHGLSVGKLIRLSGHQEFLDKLDGYERLVEGVDKAFGYNVHFDKRFIQAELERVGMEDNMEYIDIMPVVRREMKVKKGFKLSDACVYYGITEVEIRQRMEQLFGCDSTFHDARYDVTATLLVGIHAGVITGKE